MTGRLKVGQRVERNGRRGMIAALYVDRVRVNMDSAPYREDWPLAWARECRV